MSHQQHFFLEYMPAVFTSSKFPVNPFNWIKKAYEEKLSIIAKVLLTSDWYHFCIKFDGNSILQMLWKSTKFYKP